ncbi:MAG: DegV family protein [Oscillospiraceae bacterium]|nr:DegV family protein [Oscillospiraceae bacterium]
MCPYVIFTDTGCDIAPDVLAQWNVRYIDLRFHAENSDKAYIGADIPSKEFYQTMRDGAVYKTSAANIDDFMQAFKPTLEAGQDVLYLGFSSGLSGTANAARMAAQELAVSFPERKIIVIDTLCASAGEGMVVCFAVKKRDEGASLDENAAYVNEIYPQMCHWFTVDDLVYLKRGGRVSAATALVGTMLNIKPVLHVDDEGHLIKVDVARGRKQSIAALAKKYTELALDPNGGEYFISHGDCYDDAKKLADLIEAAHGVSCSCITDIGPVIGSHAGPGTIALFFLGKAR